MEELLELDENSELFKKLDHLSRFTQMDAILEQNDELISNLEKIQKSKLYEMHKHEQIMHMPAKEVHDYLKKEFDRPTKVMSKEDKVKETVEKERTRVKSEAAKVIQRTLCRHALKKKQECIYQNWTTIDPQEVPELIEKVTERLANQKIMPRTDLKVIKSQLAHHKSKLHKEAELYIKREQLMKTLQKNIDFFQDDLHLGSSKLENLELPSGPIGIEAKRRHEEFMEKLEEERILYGNLNFVKK